MGKKIVLDIEIGHKSVTVWVDKNHTITLPNRPVVLQDLKLELPQSINKEE